MALLLSTSISAGPNWRSRNLDIARTRIPVPFRGALAGARVLAGPAREATIVEPEQRSAGPALRTSFDDWYHRIHILPLRIDLGNLVTNQVRFVQVWNAYLQPQTLASVVLENGEGVELVGPGTPPLTFAPLQLRRWQLSITTEGPPVIAATLSYDFVALGSRTVTITGNRMSAWMLPPDWSRPVSETLAWATDVQQAASGGEARFPLRGSPRRSWEFSILADRRERQVLEHALFDWSARTWALPIWNDVSWLQSRLALGVQSIPVPAATQRDYRHGGLAMLWQNVTTYELVEVAAITGNTLQLARPTANAWAPGTRVLPCRTARLAETPSLERLTDQAVRSTVRLTAVETCDWPAVAPAFTYRGRPVLEQRPDLDQSPTAEFGRQLVVIDGDIGPVAIDDFTGRAWPVQSHAWQTWGRTEQANLRSLLYWLQGRASALWLPSWADDLELIEPALATSGGIVVAWAGVSRFGRAQPGRRHLRIELFNGQVLYRQLVQATELDAQREFLQLDVPHGIALQPAAIRSISWMVLARLSSDTVELSHETDGEGLARCRVSFAGIGAEESEP
ncbi:hypothetical protein [Stenotrophomonas maltophilia]|jgi:hypothetical protein|uniref:Uncharacterized protein n=10 Tax=Stenotrophomonas maltophilia TaxID=40324 RepID=A0AAI9CLS8_STEMA|nr:hypothetical protein [Stenotrophomonas maltophilia]EKT2105309.1 hypothetical protein [Stenotrophomonas maltophilia]EKZ1927603.1 hypothetical protein [Stenotrophomonas maltophilia]EMB2747404.1 hypothetical protein [Stenotrophomonas maltophilia]MBH1418665.1 hypothetical protein [Stenotrophomonas maltophilia]MBH1684684.1 hypothetical protein [Stenotrophomonas maltophilia]